VAGSAFFVVLCHDYRLVILEGTRVGRNQNITAMSSRGLTPTAQVVGVSFYLWGMANTILLQSYYAHLSAAKELALYLPISHPRRVEVEMSLNEIAAKLNMK
jgi:hypothetical protein